MYLQETNKINKNSNSESFKFQRSFKTFTIRIFIYTVGILSIIGINVQNALATPKNQTPVNVNSSVTRLIIQNSEQVSQNIQLNHTVDYLVPMQTIHVFGNKRNFRSIDREAQIAASKTMEIIKTGMHFTNEISTNYQNMIYEGKLTKKITMALNFGPDGTGLIISEMENLVREKSVDLILIIKNSVFIKDGLNLDLAKQIADYADKQITNNQVFKDICLLKANYQFFFHLKNASSKEVSALLARKEKLRAFMDGRIFVRKAALIAALEAQKLGINSGYTNEEVTQLALEAAERATLQALETISINVPLSADLKALQLTVEANLNEADRKISQVLISILKKEPNIMAIMNLETNIISETELDQLLALVKLLILK